MVRQDKDIKAFIDLVKAETDKDEDFVMDRVRKTPLYKKLVDKYENIDELGERAMERGKSYTRLREYYERREKQSSHRTVRDRERYTSVEGPMLWTAKIFEREVYDKFLWRHGGVEGAAKLAREVFDEVRDEGGNYVGTKKERDNKKNRRRA